MSVRSAVISVAFAICVSVAPALGKPAGCPCSPCKCSPCTCGGGGKKDGKHHKDHGKVGVGVNVDLGGVGQRKREADPFAAGGGDNPPKAHTEEKPKTRKETTPPPNVFSDVQLTGEQAKDETEAPSNSVNISNDTPTPVPETKEKPKKEKKDKKDKKKKNKYLLGFDWWTEFTKKWPKPFVNWIEKKFESDWADQWKDGVTDRYNSELQKYLNQNKHYREVKEQRDAAEQKSKAAGATAQDKDAFDKADRELKKLTDDLKQDFNKTDDGKKAVDNMHEAEKASDKAHDAEKAASKDIDPATKEAVENYLKEQPPPPELAHPEDPVQALW